MPKPKECPKCKAASDEINNTEDMSNAFGLNPADYKKWMCGRCSYFFNDEEAELTSWHQGRDYSKMTPFQISDVIYEDWGSKISPRALPYLEAMANLDNLNEMYGADSASDVITYFLANSEEWKGETARAVKKALEKMLKAHASQKNEV